MSNRVFSYDQAWNDYCSWIVDNNGFIHESLEFRPATSVSTSGASCVSTAPIPADTELLSCPHSVVLDYAKAKKSFPKGFIEAVPPHTALCFVVSKERMLGDASFWWPYMRILPEEFDTPLYYDHEDMEYLDACIPSGRETVEARRAAWKGEWWQGLEALRAAGESPEGYTWKLFLWAATLFTSRSFPGKLMHWEGDDQTALRGAQDDDDVLPALFPILDGLNHRPRTRITWRPGPDALSFLSVDAMAADVEVFNNYGPKSNEELLHGYGFALPNNPADTVALRFSAPLSDAQALIRAQQPQPLRPGTYYLSLSRDAATPFPRDLTTLFHILTASPSELPLLEKNPAADVVTVRNDLATEFQLFMAISRKLGSYGEVGEPRNGRQRNAKIVREGQMAVLEAAVAHSAGRVKKMFERHEGSVLFTIETVLRDRVFAEAVEKCFETADPEELVENERGDIVFVLFLCWKFLKGDGSWKKWFGYIQRFYPLPDDGADPEDGVVDVFEAIFPDAAELAPEIFGGEEWTPALMGWAMGIYQSEGVNVALEGKMLYVISVEAQD